MYAEHGYDIEQNPNFPGVKNPDFRIEGKIFDNYAPRQGTSVRNIWKTTEEKVTKKQTRRISLNLDDSDIMVDQLKEQFNNWRIRDLEEIIAIRDHQIYQIFPGIGG